MSMNALARKGIKVVSPGEGWLEAAFRLVGKFAAVIFCDDLRLFLWEKGHENSVATAFHIGDTPVIAIRSYLSPMRKIACLVHECMHFALEDVGVLGVRNGKPGFYRKCLLPHRVSEAEVYAHEYEIMAQVMRRYQELMLSTPRPADWWKNEGVISGFPNMHQRWLRDILSCVY